MASQKDKIESLIAEIESVLLKSSSRLPWSRSSEDAQQRQALEKVQTYLGSLKELFDAPGGWGPVDPQTGQVVSQPSPAIASPEESASSVLRALLLEMQYLKDNSLRPLRLELDTLKQERDALQSEIKSLETNRLQIQETTNLDETQLNTFLEQLMERLQLNLTQQLNQTVRQIEADKADDLLLEGDATFVAAEQPRLHPAQRLEQMRLVQAQSDQLLLKLDSTLALVFEALQKSIGSYKESLATGLEEMHGLGRQGEAIMQTLINHLAQRLGQDAGYYIGSGLGVGLNPSPPSEQLPGTFPGLVETPSEDTVNQLRLASLPLVPGSEANAVEPASDIDDVDSAIDDLDLDIEVALEDPSTLQLAEDDFALLSLLDDESDDEDITAFQDEDLTLFQTEPPVESGDTGLSRGAEETEREVLTLLDQPSGEDESAGADRSEDGELYESFFGEDAVPAASTEPSFEELTQVSDLEDLAAEAVVLESGLPDSGDVDWIDGSGDLPNDDGSGSYPDGSTDMPIDRETPPLDATEAEAETANWLFADAPALSADMSSEPEPVGSSLDDLFGEGLSDLPNLQPGVEPEADTVESLADILPEAPSADAGAEIVEGLDISSLDAERLEEVDLLGDRYIPAAADEDLLNIEEPATEQRLTLDLDDALMGQLDEDLQSLSEQPLMQPEALTEDRLTSEFPVDSGIDEFSTVGELPVANQPSVEDDLPTIDEIPLADEIPFAPEIPAVGELPVTDELPTMGEIPLVDEIPFAPEIPVEDELLWSAEIPLEDDLSVTDELSVTTETAIEPEGSFQSEVPDELLDPSLLGDFGFGDQPGAIDDQLDVILSPDTIIVDGLDDLEPISEVSSDDASDEAWDSAVDSSLSLDSDFEGSDFETEIAPADLPDFENMPFLDDLEAYDSDEDTAVLEGPDEVRPAENFELGDEFRLTPDSYLEPGALSTENLESMSIEDLMPGETPSSESDSSDLDSLELDFSELDTGEGLDTVEVDAPDPFSEAETIAPLSPSEVLGDASVLDTTGVFEVDDAVSDDLDHSLSTLSREADQLATQTEGADWLNRLHPDLEEPLLFDDDMPEIPVLPEAASPLESAIIPDLPAGLVPDLETAKLDADSDPLTAEAAAPDLLVPDTPMVTPDTDERLAPDPMALAAVPAAGLDLELEAADELDFAGPGVDISDASMVTDWFLGIDVGTTGLSAVLLDRQSGLVYPLYWLETETEGEKRFRLPAVAWMSAQGNMRTVGLAAWQADHQARATETPGGLLIKQLKPFMKVAIPHGVVVGEAEPILQWSETQAFPLQRIQLGLEALLQNIRTCGAVGLDDARLQQAIEQLQGVIMGYPTNWPDTYSLNLREVVLASGLVSQADRIFFIEDAIATVLSGLPDPHAQQPEAVPLSRQPSLYNCNWEGGTVVISGGATLTELALAELPSDATTLSYDDFALRSFPYAGDSIDQDIVCQLLHPRENRQPLSGSPASVVEQDWQWQAELPSWANADWESLNLDELTLPEVGESELAHRHRLRQRLESSPLGQSALEAARHLKLILQHQNQFQLDLGNQRWLIKRRDLESRTFLPYIQRMNRHLNVLLSQKGLSTQSIKQVICTGGSASLPAIARWLRQKFPNATIIQDTYTGDRPNSCSRVAYGLVNLARYPQVLDITRQQYSDYFLLMELLRVFPEQPLPVSGIMHLLEQRGINTQACQLHILALLEGHLPPGLVPTEADRPLISNRSEEIATYQALTDAPLFTKQSGQIYVPNETQGRRLRAYLEKVIATKAQTLDEPLFAQLAVETVV
ncbi:MAG: hypothetical protein AAF921_01015 [Cyanobacteria bacterium P01_D01_bin.44]